MPSNTVRLKFWGYEKKTIGRPELMNEATTLKDVVIYQSGNAASVPANTMWVEATWEDDPVDRERDQRELERQIMKHIKIHVTHAGGREELVVDQALGGGPSFQLRAGGILRFTRTEEGESSATWIMDFPVANVYKISR